MPFKLSRQRSQISFKLIKFKNCITDIGCSSGPLITVVTITSSSSHYLLHIATLTASFRRPGVASSLQNEGLRNIKSATPSKIQAPFPHSWYSQHSIQFLDNYGFFFNKLRNKNSISIYFINAWCCFMYIVVLKDQISTCIYRIHIRLVPLVFSGNHLHTKRSYLFVFVRKIFA